MSGRSLGILQSECASAQKHYTLGSSVRLGIFHVLEMHRVQAAKNEQHPTNISVIQCRVDSIAPPTTTFLRGGLLEATTSCEHTSVRCFPHHFKCCHKTLSKEPLSCVQVRLPLRQPGSISEAQHHDILLNNCSLWSGAPRKAVRSALKSHSGSHTRHGIISLGGGLDSITNHS